MSWILVHWLDITSCEHPWMSKEEAASLEPTEMWSAGTLVTEDDKCLVIAGTVEPTDGSYGNVNAIPKGVIISVRPLKVAVEGSGETAAAVRDAGIG